MNLNNSTDRKGAPMVTRIRSLPGECTGANVSGFGFSLPPRIVTNEEVVRNMVPLLDPPEEQNVARGEPTNAEWYWPRTGVLQRRWLERREDMLGHTVEACRRALEVVGIEPSQLGAIIGATVTPYLHWPTEAARVAGELGVRVEGADDTAACSSFVYAEKHALALVRAGFAQHVLVFGADNMPEAGDYTDRASFPLFGAAAGAYVISAVPRCRDSTIYLDFGQAPELGGLIGSRVLPPGTPPHPDPSVNGGLRRVTMQGTAVFRQITKLVRERLDVMLAETGIHPSEIVVCPHQANVRFRSSIFDSYGFRAVGDNIVRVGNTTSAAVPLVFGETYLRQLVDDAAPKLLPGDYVLDIAFGGGVTWGLVLRQISEDLAPAESIPWARAAIADLMRMVVPVPTPAAT